MNKKEFYSLSKQLQNYQALNKSALYQLQQISQLSKTLNAIPPFPAAPTFNTLPLNTKAEQIQQMKKALNNSSLNEVAKAHHNFMQTYKPTIEAMKQQADGIKSFLDNCSQANILALSKFSHSYIQELAVLANKANLLSIYAELPKISFEKLEYSEEDNKRNTEIREMLQRFCNMEEIDKLDDTPNPIFEQAVQETIEEIQPQLEQLNEYRPLFQTLIQKFSQKPTFKQYLILCNICLLLILAIFLIKDPNGQAVQLLNLLMCITAIPDKFVELLNENQKQKQELPPK